MLVLKHIHLHRDKFMDTQCTVSVDHNASEFDDNIALMGSFIGDGQAQTQDCSLLRNICIVSIQRMCVRAWTHVCMYVCNGKAIHVQAWTDPEGSSRLRLQISRQSAQGGGKVVSPTHRSPLPTRKCSWYSFLLQAESTASGIEPATF